MCEKVSYQIINTSAVNLLLLLEVCETHYRKKNISVGGSEQRRDTLFSIHSRETWINLFILLEVALSSSTFIFSIGIKLFIRLQWYFSASGFYQSNSMALCSFPHGVFINTDSYVFINT